MADTSKIEDVQERKKLKRAARKKAAPKGPRVGARGENKQKLKKAARGQSKRKEALNPNMAKGSCDSSQEPFAVLSTCGQCCIVGQNGSAV